MNGAHDLGGMHGLGPINPEAENQEPIFHADWEKRTLGLTLTAGMLGKWNIDISRHARERQDPVTYLSNSYYENWLAGLEVLLVESGVITKAELKSGKAENPAPADLKEKCVLAKDIKAILEKGGPANYPTDAPKTYNIGDKVRVIQMNPTGHTRAPRYIRGHIGTIVDYHGSHILPDESAKGHRMGDHLYNVAFDGNMIWGNGANSIIHLDLWQRYLESA